MGVGRRESIFSLSLGNLSSRLEEFKHGPLFLSGRMSVAGLEYQMPNA